MGTFSACLGISDGNGGSTRWVEAQVDTGATHTVIPAAILTSLGIQPKARKSASFADGRTGTVYIGNAWFRIDDMEAPSPVVFGNSDKCLLGASTLQILGLIADTTNERLIPTPEITL